jgi:hypothetical protein
VAGWLGRTTAIFQLGGIPVGRTIMAAARKIPTSGYLTEGRETTAKAVNFGNAGGGTGEPGMSSRWQGQPPLNDAEPPDGNPRANAAGWARTCGAKTQPGASAHPLSPSAQRTS